MEKTCEFITIRGIAQNCNVYPNNIISDTLNFNLLDYENIKNNDIVFVISSVLNKFVIYILPKLIKNNIKIKLVTGACVQGVPNEISNNHKINYYDLLFNKNNNIISWFTQNFDNKIQLNKIYSIPLGLDYHTLQNNDHWWGKQMIIIL